MHWPAKVVDSLSLSICWPRSLKKLFAAAITVYDYDRQSETFHVVVVGHHAQFILQRSKDNIKEQDRLLCGDAVVTVTIVLLLHHSHLLI